MLAKHWNLLRPDQYKDRSVPSYIEPALQYLPDRETGSSYFDPETFILANTFPASLKEDGNRFKISNDYSFIASKLHLYLCDLLNFIKRN